MEPAMVVLGILLLVVLVAGVLISSEKKSTRKIDLGTLPHNPAGDQELSNGAFCSAEEKNPPKINPAGDRGLRGFWTQNKTWGWELRFEDGTTCGWQDKVDAAVFEAVCNIQ